MKIYLKKSEQIGIIALQDNINMILRQAGDAVGVLKNQIALIIAESLKENGFHLPDNTPVELIKNTKGEPVAVKWIEKKKGK